VKTSNEKAVGEPTASSRTTRTEAILLAFGLGGSGFFSRVLSLLSRVGSIFSSVGSVVSSGHVGGASSGVGRNGGSVSSLSGGVCSSLRGLVTGRSHFRSGGRGFSSFSGRVFSLLLVGASGQGETQGQGDERLVESHGSFLVVLILGNAQLRAVNMMTSP
jgi:hypothetical protein